MKRRTFLSIFSAIPATLIFKPKKRLILTTVSGIPVYEMTKELKNGDIMNAKYFISVCDLPNPENHTVAPSHYKGDRIIYNNKYVKKMWL